jgi:hypothetical protein
MLRRLSILFLIVCWCFPSHGQDFFSVPDSVVKWRQVTNVTTQSAITVSTLGGLQIAWYQDYQNGGFHFFNDWPGWMQMDKLGHLNATYQIARNVHGFNRWSGMNNTRSAIWAASAAMAYQCSFEVMDGFSEGWGFSVYDVLFNAMGASAFIAQQLTWKEQRIKIKYGFFPSGLNRVNETETNMREVQRAEHLYGKSIAEQWLKDYNGITTWASANIYAMIGKPDGFPKWLNIAIGMSTNNVLGAESNHWTIQDASGNDMTYQSPYVRERQVLLSLDIDVDQFDLPPRWVWIKGVVGFVKFPFPAIEWNSERGIVAHALYF